MDKNELKIELIPSYEFIGKKLGYKDYEFIEYDTEISSIQGAETEILFVQPGEKFVINPRFQDVYVSCEEMKYRLIEDSNGNEDFNPFEDEESDYITLTPGEYIFNLDGLTIEKLENENFGPDDEIIDPVIQLIWGTITNSAKEKFDFPEFELTFSFINEEFADTILSNFIRNLAEGEEKKMFVGKLESELMVLGYMLPNKGLHKLFESKEEVFEAEIKTAALAMDMLEQNINAVSVLQFVQQMLHKGR
ncbi:MAG: hypothetical protein EOO43_00425 [Flavobacterium sp.]|nr:MAG: hypothetical protein EOO43_00425 [Flavobacterium sp.]